MELGGVTAALSFSALTLQWQGTWIRHGSRRDSSFIVVGYGTKMGLAPMHTWLPDAHSEAPEPGLGFAYPVCLLNCAYLGHL